VSNLPVCLIEADRDESTSSSRKFDWEELKTAYNGRAVRSRGMKTGGNETYEPPFRGGIVISQNNAVNGSDAILQRIIHLNFDRDHHTPETKLAADELAGLGVDVLSHFLVIASQSEKQTLAHFNKAMPEYEKRIQAQDGVKTMRIAKNHAQLMCLADSFAQVAGLSKNIVGEMHHEIMSLAVQRQHSIGADHPIVQQFWEIYDFVGSHILNHTNTPGKIAINMQEFVSQAAEHKLQVPLVSDLRNHLKGSKSRTFIKSNYPIASRNLIHGKSKTVRCWLFEDGEQ
jgi:hypothetical protein